MNQHNGSGPSDGNHLATLAGGCFWCLEAVYNELRGVESVVSGYAGGHDPAPTYESVCSGTTGHAEVVQIAFDPDMVSFRELLEVFFTNSRSDDPEPSGQRRGHAVPVGDLFPRRGAASHR